MTTHICVEVATEYPLENLVSLKNVFKFRSAELCYGQIVNDHIKKQEELIWKNVFLKNIFIYVILINYKCYWHAGVKQVDSVVQSGMKVFG